MKTSISILFLVLSFLLPILSPRVVAQNTLHIDSLEAELKTAKDTTRVKILNAICWEYNSSNPEKAIEYGKQGLVLAKQLGFKKGIANSLNNIGEVKRIQGNYEKALEYFLQSLKIREDIEDKKGIAASLMNIGNINYYQRRFDDALNNYLQSLKIREDIGDKKGAAELYGNIGSIYSLQKDYKKSLEFLQQSLATFEQLKEKGGIQTVLNNIASIYFAQNKYGEAIEHYLQSIKISEEIGNKQGIAMSFGNIGTVFFEQGNYKKAIEYSEKGLSIAKETGLKGSIEHAYKNLADIYGKQNNYQKAYEYHQLYAEMKDSLLNEESTKAIVEMQTKYETEKKEKEIVLQKAELIKKDAEVKQKNTQRNAFITGFGLVLILAVVALRGYLQKKKAKEIIEAKNKDITASIQYASLIQDAVLPLEKDRENLLPESFVLYKPKDIVSGDFYWITEKHSKVFFTVADCTGHGVPGAFMSMIGNSLLNEIVNKKGIIKPNEILNELRNGIINSLKQTGEQGEQQDGMDMAFCALDRKNNILEYAGAYNPLYLIRNNELKEIKPDRMPVGIGKKSSFTNNQVQLQKGDTIYIFSDGLQDQFGGERNKKFSTKRLKETLLSMQSKSMPEQKEALNQIIEQWKGKLGQTDDILMIGVRV